jgi:hypothetical protein
MAVAEPDWSELPKDLLYLISQRTDNEIDFIHFRSVCSTWRSSTIPYHDHILPFKVPLLDNKSFSYLLKGSYFLIKPSPHQQQQQEQTLVHRPWMIGIGKNLSGMRIGRRIRKKDWNTQFYFHSTDLDFIKLSVHHLRTDYFIDGPFFDGYGYWYPKKVVVVTPLIIAILFYGKDHLVLSCCSDERWTEIPDMPSSIGDICVFKGQLYAVEKYSGKIVTVAPEDLSVQLVAKDVFGGEGDIKFLVESEGQLLLADVYASFDVDFDHKDAFKIHVFRLDENEKKWVKLPSLGDRILFLGDNGSFSASASDLYIAKGNCVIFVDYVYDDSLCVFQLDQGQLSPWCDYPEYLNLFGSPPKWIIKKGMHKSKKSMLS